MSEKKLLFKFDSDWQAQPAVDLLKSENIQVYLISTPREYTSIVTGIGQTGVSIYVEDTQYDQAQALLFGLLQRSKIHIVSDENLNENSTKTKNYFRRVMFFSFGGMFFLPILFNIVAALNLPGLFKYEESNFKKTIAVICFCLAWFVGGIELYWIIMNYIIKV